MSMLNPRQVGGSKVFNDLYVDQGSSSSAAGRKRKAVESNADVLSLDEMKEREGNGTGAKQLRVDSKASVVAEPSRTIYAGSLPLNVTEKPLLDYFSSFGEVIECHVIRDRASGISRGFAFVTFACESMAESAMAVRQHVIEGAVAKVSFARKNESSESPGGMQMQGPGVTRAWLDQLEIPRQIRIYIGPLEDSIIGMDLVQQFSQFGTIKGVSRIKPSSSSSGSLGGSNSSYGLIDYQDSISVRRAFGSKIFVKGKHVKIALSRFVMELILSSTAIYFFEAHSFCDDASLEKHFSQYGQVFRCMHLVEPTNGLPKSYGFVDFVAAESASRAVAHKSQLILTNDAKQSSEDCGQRVRVSRLLPATCLFDLLSMGDAEGNAVLARLERTVPAAGTWGAHLKPAQRRPAQQQQEKDDLSTSKVRIPAALVPKLIGERGKTITELCRDTKTRLSVPKAEEGSNSVVVTIEGKPEGIKAAQYLMQKILKS